MIELNSFQRDMLYVIVGADNPTGLEIKRTIDKYYTREINHGQLYPALNKLENLGLVQKRTINQRKNEYVLTEKAKRVLRERRKWDGEQAENYLYDI